MNFQLIKIELKTVQGVPGTVYFQWGTKSDLYINLEMDKEILWNENDIQIKVWEHQWTNRAQRTVFRYGYL